MKAAVLNRQRSKTGSHRAISSWKKAVMALQCAVFCVALVACSNPAAGSPDTLSSMEQAPSSVQSQNISSESTLPIYPNIGIITDKTNTYNSEIPTYPTVNAFLEKFGFADAAPFYTFDHTKRLDYDREYSAQKIELYYSEALQEGCVLIYENDLIRGLAFHNVEGISKNDESLFFNPFADPFEPTPCEDSISPDKIRNYQEKTEKRADGKPVRFAVTGLPDGFDETESEELYSYTYSYRKDGTLEKKTYWHNSRYFSTTHSGRTGYYDADQRLIFEHSYITHGDLEYYTIYLDDSKTPSYQLALDYDIGYLVSAQFIQYQ